MAQLKYSCNLVRKSCFRLLCYVFATNKRFAIIAVIGDPVSMRQSIPKLHNWHQIISESEESSHEC